MASVSAMLITAGSSCLDGPVVQHHQLIGSQRETGIGAALVIGEFDLEYIRSKWFDNGTDLSARKPALRKVFRKSHDIEKRDGTVHDQTPRFHVDPTVRA